MKTIVKIVVLAALVVVFVWLARRGYEYPWTGFAAQPAVTGGEPAKTLWDWLDLLIVPVVLAIGAFLLESSRKRGDERAEKDRQRQQVLDDYFAYISELVLNGKLAEGNAPDHVRCLARTRTLTALRLIDGARKGQVLQFLYEAGLILKDPVVQLNGADCTHANLDEATLRGVELRGVYFGGASIRRANLADSDFRGSDFTAADFADTDLSRSKLRQANFTKASLDRVRLSEILGEDVQLTDEQRAQLKTQQKIRGRLK